ncbi:actin cross-linking domain-containing toxin [Kribbella sp. NPDC055110]
MPRPSDWDAIGLGGDPTPGDPEQIGQLAEVLQKLGGKAREIVTAVESVMNTNNDSVFVGATAEALRGKVDGRLRGHVEDVATAFETSAQALRDWRGVVDEQQRKADGALNAGRGLAADDPNRETQKGIAEQAGRDQSDQASTYAGRINGVSDIQLPISECEAFWEAFKWLAIILIIPALIFGGPIALLALGVNLALFIKTIVDVANGDATFLDLFLAGLGLIAPTTKALPIFSILKGIAKGIGAGVKGIANTFRTVFSKDFLFNSLLVGLKGMPMLAGLAIKETGLFVISNIRNFAITTGQFVSTFDKVALGAFNSFKTGITTFRPGSIVTGFKSAWNGVATSGFGQFVSGHFGGLQWTRMILPVAADEIRAFKALGMSNFAAFTQALKVGVIGRGVFAENVFGLPTVGALGRGIGAIPIEHGAGAGVGKTSFLQQLVKPEIRIPSVHINSIGVAVEGGFKGGQVFTALDELHLAPMQNISSTNIGVSVHTPTTVTTGGVHIPATAGTPGAVNVITNIPSPHVGVPATSGNNAINGLVHGLPNQGQIGTPVLNGVNHALPTPGSTSISDLVGSGLRNNPPTISSHFATTIGEGTSHGFQANHVRLSIDEIVNLPAPNAHGSTHAVSAPTVDRVNAALDLLTGGPANLKIGAPSNLHVGTPPVGGAQHVATPPGVPGRSEIPLSGLPDHPGVVVKVERFDGGMTQFNLHGGGPNGRLDPLSGGHLRFTDTSTGTTTRFDSNGIVVDHGVRLTKADGMPRIDDRVLVKQPDGQFRVTGLDGNAVPENLTVRQLDTGGVQILGKDGASWHYTANGKLDGQNVTSSWNGDVAGKAGVFGKADDLDTTVGIQKELGDDIGLRPELGSAVPVRPAGLSETAFNQLATTFDAAGLRQFQGMGDVVSRSTTSVDGLSRTVHVSKPGFADELTITVLRNPQTDSVRVIGTADGVNTFDKTWSGSQFANLTADQFHALPKPAQWDQTAGKGKQLDAAWEQDLAAKVAVFRVGDDTDAIVNAKLTDTGRVQQAQAKVDAALEDVAVRGLRGDGPSTGLSVGEQVHLDLRAAQAELSTAKTAFETRYGLQVADIQSQLDTLTAQSLKDRPRLLGGHNGHTTPPGRTRPVAAPGFGREFDGASFGSESELGGFVVAMPEGTNRTFAFVKEVGTDDPLIMVTKDMSNGIYRNPDGLPQANGGNWRTHTVELVSYPAKVGDQAGITIRDEATQFLLDVFKGRINLANHRPMEPVISADGRFALQITNDRHVIASGNGMHLDEPGSVSMPPGGQQLTVGVQATDFAGAAGNDLRLLDNPWYKPEFGTDDALRAISHELDNPQQVENAYTYLKSIMSFTAKQVDKHGIPIGDYAGKAPYRGLTDPAVKNDWAVLPRTRPNIVLESLSGPDRAATLKLLRETPAIGDTTIWKEVRQYLLGGGEVAGHGINNATIAGEKALLFEFRTVPDGLKHLVPKQATPVVNVTDTLAGLGPRRADVVRQLDTVLNNPANRDDFASWFGELKPNLAGKPPEKLVGFASATQKAEWLLTHRPETWQGLVQEPVIVNMVHVAHTPPPPPIRQHQLTGAFNDHTVVRPTGAQPHVTGPNAERFTVHVLQDGGFRVVGPRGQMQRYGVDGAHLGDGTMLNDPFHLRGSFFTETDPAGGLRAVDVNGTPLPHTTVEQLPNGQFRVADTALGDVRWHGQDGLYRGSGIRVADPARQGQVFLYHQLGQEPVLLDNAGAQLPGTVTTFEGGFRVTEANGIARTFDDAGIYVDRRIPLGAPNAQQIVIHDVNNHLTLHDPAGAGRTIGPVQGGGYRVVDGGNYHVYDGDGAFQAHGHTVDLPGETGFLEIAGNTARRLDVNYQPIQGRTVTFNAGEFTVTRAGGHDVFDQQGGVLRQITDLDGHGLGAGATRVTRDQNGIVTWTDRNGAAVPTPHRVTVDQHGVVRLEINAPGSPRNGEFHVFSRDGHLTEQGFPVVRNGRPTEFTYVVNRTDNTWRRVDNAAVDGTGNFQHGKVDIAGLDNGRIRLQSSTAKEVEVFERRWLPDGTILDSFRKTDTLGYGAFDRRTTWATYDANGVLTNWGKRHFGTDGASWRDYDHHGNSVRDYQQGLQKYANPIAEQPTPLGKADKEITGHVLAIKDGRNWTWHRYDAQGVHVADGNRTLEAIGEGWTDTVRVLENGNEVTRVAQQKWGTWHGPDTARQYQEFKLEAGAGHPTRSGEFEVQSPQLKSVGKGELLDNGALLKTVRQGDQRPPIWVRENFLDNPPTTGSVAHISGDNRFQIFRWDTSGNGIDAGQGIRYVGTDESIVDVNLNGEFVRSKGKLHDGTELKVGDHATTPGTAHPNSTTPWTAGDVNGWRVFDNTNGWRDVAEVDGLPGWTVVRESHPGGAVREYTQPGDRNIWVQRDPHGNLVGSSHRTPAPVGGNHRYVVATGTADSSHWRWQELDHNGVPIAGREGDRFHFKGSGDERVSWDNSFRDFDAGGNLIRDRHLLDERRFVESWQDGNQWRVAEFDKAGVEVADTTRLERQWLDAEGNWQHNWTAGSQHFRDSLPQNGQVMPQLVRETPTHVGDGRPIRVREYKLENGQTDLGQWKEFDFDKVVRERVASGNNFLETDKIHGQWKLYDQQGQVIGERSDNGLVFELRDGRLTLTGNEFDFRGALTEYRGWNTRIADAQRQPWLMQSDWTLSDKTLTPGGNVFREATYAPFSRLLTQKVLLQVGTEFILDYAASLMILGIVAEAQNKPFTGNDALKALMNAAVGATLKSVAGAALTETKLGGSLRNLKQNMGNLDGGKPITRRPNNNDATWGVEWAGNTSPVRWRGGIFDYSLNMLLLPLTGFVNGTMNAAIFGVPNADGKTVKLSGWEAVGEGGIAVLNGYAIANSLGLLKLIGGNFGAGRFFQKAGFADIVLTMPLRLFEKGIGGVFLTPAIRASINPAWYQVPPVEGAQ